MSAVCSRLTTGHREPSNSSGLQNFAGAIFRSSVTLDAAAGRDKYPLHCVHYIKRASAIASKLTECDRSITAATEIILCRIEVELVSSELEPTASRERRAARVVRFVE